MAESLLDQVLAFAWMAVAGSLIGFIFDFYRVLRGRLRPGPRGTWIGDLGFWLLCTALVFAFMLRSNFGDFRLYVLLGVVVGALAYHQFLSWWVIRTLVFLWRAASGAAGFVGGAIFSFVRKAYITWRRSWLRKAGLKAYQRLKDWASTSRTAR
jgi:spore cortex biosynthesis protein YabQ